MINVIMLTQNIFLSQLQKLEGAGGGGGDGAIAGRLGVELAFGGLRAMRLMRLAEKCWEKLGRVARFWSLSSPGERSLASGLGK